MYDIFFTVHVISALIFTQNFNTIVAYSIWTCLSAFLKYFIHCPGSAFKLYKFFFGNDIHDLCSAPSLQACIFSHSMNQNIVMHVFKFSKRAWNTSNIVVISHHYISLFSFFVLLILFCLPEIEVFEIDSSFAGSLRLLLPIIHRSAPWLTALLRIGRYASLMDYSGLNVLLQTRTQSTLWIVN